MGGKEPRRIVFNERSHLVEDAVASFQAARTGGKVGGEGVGDVGHLSVKVHVLILERNTT